MTSLSTTKREAIATALRTQFADMPGGWAVFASQRDTVSLPCVVIGARDPYREPLTLKDSSGVQKERLNLFAGVFIRRDAGNEALDLFDEACDRVLAALHAVSYPCGWGSFSAPGGLDVDGTPALAASLDFEVV